MDIIIQSLIILSLLCAMILASLVGSGFWTKMLPLPNQMGYRLIASLTTSFIIGMLFGKLVGIFL